MRRLWRFVYPSRLFTPRGLIVRAAVLTTVFLLLHTFGLRDYTCIFSGTSPTGAQPPGVATAALGATYAVLYLLVVMVVPILTLAAGFLFVFQRWAGKRNVRLNRG